MDKERDRLSASIARLFLLILMLSACSPGIPATPAREAEDRIPFEPHACWMTVPATVKQTCGFVVVPENRSKPLTEDNTIRLAVVILSAPGTKYTQPPTFLLGGGPGQDVVGLFDRLFKDYQNLLDNGYPAEQYAGHLQDMQQFKTVMDRFVMDLQKREFVLFDQRGAGYSQPSLKCHGEDWHVCRDRLIASGVDLASYNTVENVEDVNDIRMALGYEQINLQGGSYGTKLALETMRKHPSIVRAAVLDGVAPSQMNWGVEMVSRYDDALQVLFDHCKADPQCEAAFPGLESVFYRLIPKLNEQPVYIDLGENQVELNGNDFRDTVWNALYDSITIRFLPLLIRQVNEGNTDVWKAFLSAKASADSEDTAWGMHYSVDCAERWSFQDRQDLVDASLGLRPEIREGVVDYFDDPFWICEEWDVPAAPAFIHTPVQSDIPTLLLSGEFDPGTPPAFADMAAETLTHHYNIVLPYLGHTDGFNSPCHASIQSSFLDDPSRVPDTACVAEMDISPFIVK